MKIKTLYFLCSILIFNGSCGDILSSNLHITRNYFLSDGEMQGSYSISLKDENNTLIKKVTENVIEYGFSDSIIVAKVFYDNGISYYIINMNKDFDVAKENIFRIGPLKEEDFLQNWDKQLHIKLRSTKDIRL